MIELLIPYRAEERPEGDEGIESRRGLDCSENTWSSSAKSECLLRQTKLQGEAASWGRRWDSDVLGHIAKSDASRII